MQKKIYVINGSGGVGKDTFCLFTELYTESVSISSIDPVKDIAIIMGWKGKKTEKDRKMLSDLKDLMTRYNDYPMKFVRHHCSRFIDKDDVYYKDKKVLFIHIREPQEIERVVKEFGAETILIKNSNVKAISSNHADANVENYKYDHIIYNNGTLEEFKSTVKLFCEKENLI